MKSRRPRPRRVVRPRPAAALPSFVAFFALGVAIHVVVAAASAAGAPLRERPAAAAFLGQSRRGQGRGGPTILRPLVPPPSSSRPWGRGTERAEFTVVAAAAAAASGRGMGMGMGGGGGGGRKGGRKIKKKGGKKKFSSSSSSSGSSNGGSSDGTVPFDASAALLRSERLYEEITAEVAKRLMSDEDDEDDDCITSEYVVAARCVASSSSDANSASVVSAAASDWVPVAQLVAVRPYSSHRANEDDDDERKRSLRVAVTARCRELHRAATLAAPAAFGSVPRNAVQYGIEPIESFYRYVYDDVIEGRTPGASSFAGAAGNGDDADAGAGAMTKARARLVLGLEEGCSDVSAIRRAYRSKSFELHPDRFVGADETTMTDEERRGKADEFALVKSAYDALCSGLRQDATVGGVGGGGSVSGGGSWYESLGGRQRTDFYGPVELSEGGIREAIETIERRGERTAVVGLDYDLVMSFVARNQAAATAAAAAKAATTTQSVS